MKATFASVVSLVCLLLCGCGSSHLRNLPKDKVVLQVSLAEKRLLLSRLGLTNLLYYGNVERDSTGTKLFIRVETGLNFDKARQWLVVVTAESTRVKPWRRPANERVTDDEQVAVWEDREHGYRWQSKTGAWLPDGSHVEDVSANWLAAIAPGRSPWIARLETPDMAAVELPGNVGFLSIFATNNVVHVFTRRGWRNAEGPMRYLAFDFQKAGTNAIQDKTFTWARAVIDMDPLTGFAVINDNNSFWGRTWLVNLVTGNRNWIPTADWTLIVKKDVAAKWIEMTKP